MHRIGRTARLGARGEAISFACEDYAFHLPDVEEYIGYAIPMESHGPEMLPEIEKPPPAPRSRSRHRRQGGRGGKGKRDDSIGSKGGGQGGNRGRGRGRKRSPKKPS